MCSKGTGFVLASNGLRQYYRRRMKSVLMPPIRRRSTLLDMMLFSAMLFHSRTQSAMDTIALESVDRRQWFQSFCSSKVSSLHGWSSHSGCIICRNAQINKG
ncbi:hypothetical protein T08_1645 [Trichinella sp. T8]|nr:hypothetical protein T08_1645 [Trichinella sp. T8]